MQAVTVFCGSSSGKSPLYAEHARSLGALLAARHCRLVYGGASIGLMGQMADAVLENQGTVTGVIPDFLGSKEIVHTHLTELIYVNSMHERKMKMHELCDGFIALPGGWGTMDELFEILTWAQLGLHKKPVAVWNINGYFSEFRQWMDKMIAEKFVRPHYESMLIFEDELDVLWDKMIKYKAPDVPVHLHKSET